MASTLAHFADPHALVRSLYTSTTDHLCDLCGFKVAGLIGYRCNSCNFDAHEACADYFKKTVSFFAHPWHDLTLSRIPVNRGGAMWECDLCREECVAGSLVYRCVPCGVDVHPVCTMLPQVIRSPLHKEHCLRMAPSSGNCSACREPLPVWHYRCGLCMIKVHIGCADGTPDTAASRPSRGNRVAKYLLKESFKMAINLATNGMASAVVDVLF